MLSKPSALFVVSEGGPSRASPDGPIRANVYLHYAYDLFIIVRQPPFQHTVSPLEHALEVRSLVMTVRPCRSYGARRAFRGDDVQ